MTHDRSTSGSRLQGPRQRKERFAGVGEPSPERTAQIALAQDIKQIRRDVARADVRGELNGGAVLAALAAAGVLVAHMTPWVLAFLLGAIVTLVVRGYSQVQQAQAFVDEQLRNAPSAIVHEVRLYLSEMRPGQSTSLQFAAQLRRIEHAHRTLSERTTERRQRPNTDPRRSGARRTERAQPRTDRTQHRGPRRDPATEQLPRALEAPSRNQAR